MNANAKNNDSLSLTQTVATEIPFPLKKAPKAEVEKGSAQTIRTAHGGEHIVASAGEKVIAESDSCVVATEGSQVVALSGSKVIFTPGSQVTIHVGSEVIDPFGSCVTPRPPASSKARRAAITGYLDAYVPGAEEKLTNNNNQQSAHPPAPTADKQAAQDAAEIKRLLGELNSLISQQQARQFGEFSKIVKSLQAITVSTTVPVKRTAPKPPRNVDRRKFLRRK